MQKLRLFLPLSPQYFPTQKFQVYSLEGATKNEAVISLVFYTPERMLEPGIIEAINSVIRETFIMITYKTSKKLDARKLFDLYESVDWTKNVRNKEKHGKLLSNVYAHSDGVFSAWDGKRLIGVIRFITDVYAHGIIFGLAIHPQYQNRGIGAMLIRKCVKVHPRIQWETYVESSPQFYIKLGFKESEYKAFSKGICPV